ncbi:hypothetical protein GDO78_001692 [Eleutherodactylus coqui]|uniref:Cation-transporting ATPase n=1 Tax=Eleutherodactylus coqui TaxID=57060 RepID=A0A8J6KI75_ELECQ|nr:hypothetical protein GDO78_001692 [Eleutherodactylus coqui]
MKTDTRVLLNPGEENEMDLFGYRTQMWKQALCIIGYIFSLGFLLLLFYWKPEWDVWCQCASCSLEKANIILLRTTDDFKKYSKKKVFWVEPFKTVDKELHGVTSDEKSLIGKALIMPDYKVRCIRVQKIRYIWNTLEKNFQKIGALEDEYSCSDIHTRFGCGFTQEEQEMRKQVCGLNAIEVEVTPIWKLLFKEVLNPFYIFQAFSLSLWFATGYTEYAAVLVGITLLSIAATIYNLRMQSVKLHKMVSSHNSMKVTILGKNGGVQELESQYLVPGDVLVLTGRFYLPCDSILISGSCVVNEGMLTGESVPVTKTPLPNINNSIPWKIHSGEDYKRHVLFCGTEVIQAQAPNKSIVKAVVLRTGFNTAKGDLVRSILYPKPVNFKLHRDAIRFLMGLVAVTVVGVIYTPIVYTNNGMPASDVVLWTLLIVTVAIPAALPAAVTVCILYSQTRLQRSGIFCLSAQRINMCGQLNIICFDKTGTLTEDGMELWGMVPSYERSFQEVHCFTPGSSLPCGPVLLGMVSCHSLIILDGKVQGDPLDLKMFEGTGWVLQDTAMENNEDEDSQSYKIIKPGPDSGEDFPVEAIAILHQFPFSSSLQRMSVIAEVVGDDEFLVFMKGAPEMVEHFCIPETVPLNFPKELENYTLKGFRVIALAYKKLATKDVQIIESLEREEVESDLVFLGFLIMENKLKPETKAVLQELMAAKIRTVMITGDNLQTACTVGKTSGMIPPGSNFIVIEANAPDGSSPASITWGNIEQIQENGHVSKILLNATIFARMSPGQKSSLIEEFQKIDYYAGMCGDGANDCGALKMAHAGISLSELEASVASPFTSKTPNIECVPKLIKEGRNCLVTSFCVFKYIAMYAMIELICLLLLFWEKKVLGTRHYLMQDMAITITVTLTMSLTGPALKLAPYRPSGQLISPPLLLSMISHIIFSLVVQTIAFTVVQQQPWYNDSDVLSGCLPLNHSAPNITIEEPLLTNRNFLTTTMWFISGMNLIIVEIVFCKGRPFRKPIYTNCKYKMWALVTCFLFLTCIIRDERAYSSELDARSSIRLVCTPYYWRWNTCIMVAALFVVSYLAEEGFIENRRLWLMLKSCFNYHSRSQYRVLERALCNDPTWPPQGQTHYSNKKELGIDLQKYIYDNPTFDAGAENSLELS